MDLFLRYVGAVFAALLFLALLALCYAGVVYVLKLAWGA